MGFLHHKLAPWPQKGLNWSKTSKVIPKCHVLLWQGTQQTLHRQPTPLSFHQMTLDTKSVRAQESGGSQITKWLPDHKSGLNWSKTSKTTTQNTLRSGRGTNRCYYYYTQHNLHLDTQIHMQFRHVQSFDLSVQFPRAKTSKVCGAINVSSPDFLSIAC